MSVDRRYCPGCREDILTQDPARCPWCGSDTRTPAEKAAETRRALGPRLPKPARAVRVYEAQRSNRYIKRRTGARPDA